MDTSLDYYSKLDKAAAKPGFDNGIFKNLDPPEPGFPYRCEVFTTIFLKEKAGGTKLSGDAIFQAIYNILIKGKIFESQI